jgi:hypothetical protein
VATKPDDVAKQAIQPITNYVQQILDKQRTAKIAPSVDESPLWAKLMSLDKMSVRQFFSS